MKKTLVMLLAMWITASVWGKDNNHTFLHVNNEMGLSQSNVKAIVQDSYGFMWFGTKNGLNRYDGRTMRRKECRDAALNRSNQNVSALLEDSNHTLWIGTDQGVYQYDQRTERMTYFDQKTKKGKKITNWIACITEDPLGDIWILAPSEGLFRWHKGTLHCYCDDLPDGGSPSWCTVCENGDVWACTWYNGLWRYHPQQDRFVQVKQDSKGNSLMDMEINMICQQGDNLIFGIQTGGVMAYNGRTGVLRDISTPELRNNIVRNVYAFGKDIWIGCYDGAYVMNDKFEVTQHYYQDRGITSALSDNIVYCCYQDRDGGIWLGTMFGGVNYLPRRDIEFHSISPTNTPHLQSERIREMVKTGDGNIWIGTELAGFYSMKESTHEVTRHVCPAGNNKNVTLCIASHRGETLLSYFKSGVEVVRDGKTQKFYPFKDLKLRGSSVYALTYSRDGDLWVGTDGGIYRGHKGFDGMELIKADQWCFDILESMDGTMWFATMGSGVFHYNPKTKELKNYRNREGKPGELSSNSVSSIMEDSKGRIWLSTDRGGLCRYNKQTDDFTRFSTHEGLPDDMAYEVVEDKEGNLWFGTNHGLVKFNPENQHIRVFTTQDGLAGNEFNYKSALIGNNGCFYFGTTEGITWFDPQEMREESKPYPIYFSRLSILNHEITMDDEDTPLKKTLLETDHITLPHNRANFSLEVAMLNYATPQNNTYEYQLEPVDKEWVQRAANQSISFANLAPGEYILHLRARTMTDGKATFVTRDLKIKILPPWWRSVWAYLFYIIVLAGGVGCWFRWYRARKNNQLAEQKHLFEVEKEKELFENKVTFFTGIAHEIRTPLTLITGPLEVINRMKHEDGTLTRNLRVVTNNVERLMTLATQLLDFQRLGNQEMHLDRKVVDMSQLVQETYDRFESTFSLRGKTLTISHMDEHVMALVDKEAITKILSNLLNNALKYSTSASTISLDSDDSKLRLQVVSDGARIPNERAEEIFQPFVQLEERDRGSGGIGIGLGMARSLALLHHGTLALDRHHEQNCFVLDLPLSLPDESEEVTSEASTATETGASTATLALTDKHRTLLVVEDEKELLEFIKDQLCDTYNVLTAHNGLEALDVLKNNKIDLVITDLMMPQMDGFTLTEQIKQDAEHEQIPVVILTAKGDIDSKIRGLKAGAESYVEKPFSVLYLRSLVGSLLENRHRERVAFSKRPFLPENNKNVSQEDQELVDRIVYIVNANLMDENFNVEKLATELCMSRSSLLRRVRTLFNVSPLDLIRLVRLKQAAEMIQSGKYRVGEISQLVGFSSQSYFSRLFVRQFGMTPKEFEKQVAQQRNKPGMITELDLGKMLQDAATNDAKDEN